LELFNKKLLKKILGKRGVDFVRSIRDAHPKKMSINKHGKHFTVDSTKIRSYKFWKGYVHEGWEDGTFKIFDKFLDKNHSYIDIGSYIGPTVLYGSQLTKHCFAIEPDPIAFQELKNNIELNDNLKSHITLSKYCITDSVGVTKLFTSGRLKDGGGSGSTLFPDLDDGFVDQNKMNFWEVQTITMQKFIQSLSITDCNFIKIDIEGAEFNLIPSMSDYIKNQKPTLLIEIHLKYVENPMKKLDLMFQTLDVYNYIYDVDLLKKIDKNELLNLARSHDIIHILLTDIEIHSFKTN
jgi:FkbM family methyltransferase